MIRCIKFRPYVKNTLKGFASIELTKSGLILHECTFHQRDDGKEWIGFPGRKYADKNNKEAWANLIEFTQSADRHLFQTHAVEAIHAYLAEQKP